MRYLLLFLLSFPAYATVLEFKDVLFDDGTSVSGHITLGEPVAPGSQPGVLDFVIQTQAGDLPALTYSKGNSSEKGLNNGLLFASPFESAVDRRLFFLDWGSFLPPPFPLGICQTPQSTDCMRIVESTKSHAVTLLSREAISGSLVVGEVPEPSIAALLSIGLISAGIYKSKRKRV